MFEHEVICSSL